MRVIPFFSIGVAQGILVDQICNWDFASHGLKLSGSQGWLYFASVYKTFLFFDWDGRCDSHLGKFRPLVHGVVSDDGWEEAGFLLLWGFEFWLLEVVLLEAAVLSRCLWVILAPSLTHTTPYLLPLLRLHEPLFHLTVRLLHLVPSLINLLQKGRLQSITYGCLSIISMELAFFEFRCLV